MHSRNSVWMDTATSAPEAALSGDRQAEVAIVGAGLAGILTAVELVERGRNVVLLEAGTVGHGVSGYTTAKITSAHRLIYDRLGANASAYAEANQWGLERLIDVLARWNVEADVERKPMWVIAESDPEREELLREYDAARAAGLLVQWSEAAPFPMACRGAIRYERQAQFHPVKAMRGLAARLRERGVQVFEGSRVLDTKRSDEGVTLRTAAGSVQAERVVIASHYPVYDPAMYFARLFPYRDYAMAVRVEGDLPTDMAIGASNSSHAYRPYGDLLIASGEGHKVGQGDGEACYGRLEAVTRDRFRVVEVVATWSTQDNETLDGMPYIGRIQRDDDRIYLLTGFGAWGMTTSAYGARIVADGLDGIHNAWAETFDPSRGKGLEGAVTYVKENANAAKHLVGDKILPPDDIRVADLRPGQAAVIGGDDGRRAIYRDPGGRVHCVSSSCTHMGCQVAWNAAETSWDCPCHGSRFAPDGEVLQGPAVNPLAPAPLPD